MPSKEQTYIFFGTYDLGKPRVRLLLLGLEEQGVMVLPCHRDAWSGIEDKSQIKGVKAKLRRAARLLLSYPVLLWRYLRMPAHGTVICTYPGMLDVLLVWPLARLRGAIVVWDVFISLYDTVVRDRHMASPGSLVARALYGLEWLACRAADTLVMDTGAHARALEKLYDLKPESVQVVYVGCERSRFYPPVTPTEPGDTFQILFYGQFIPLHGIEIIVQAMKLIEGRAADVHCTMIGMGQESERIEALLDTLRLKNVERVEWVPYRDLVTYIQKFDACLGIFHGSGKAACVVPNKAYQVLACGSYLLTGDTPAAREVLGGLPQVRLVRPDSPEALAEGILQLRDDLRNGKTPRRVEPFVVDAEQVGEMLLDILDRRPKRASSPDEQGHRL